jgi:hypothetical protein
MAMGQSIVDSASLLLGPFVKMVRVWLSGARKTHKD